MEKGLEMGRWPGFVRVFVLTPCKRLRGRAVLVPRPEICIIPSRDTGKVVAMEQDTTKV